MSDSHELNFNDKPAATAPAPASNFATTLLDFK